MFYGSTDDESASLVMQKNIASELGFNNLIMIASNPVLFGSLDEKTQKELMAIVATYTRSSINLIRYDARNNNIASADGLHRTAKVMTEAMDNAFKK